MRKTNFNEFFFIFRNDEKFRKALVKTVPSTEPVLKYALGEENPFEGVTKTFDEYKSTVTGWFNFGSDKPSTDVKPVPKQLQTIVPKTIKEPTTTPAKKPEAVKPTQQAATPAVPKPAKPFVIPANVAELEKQVDVAATLAVNEYNNAIKMLTR